VAYLLNIVNERQITDLYFHNVLRCAACQSLRFFVCTSFSHFELYELCFISFKVHKVQAKNKVHKDRTSQLWRPRNKGYRIESDEWLTLTRGSVRAVQAAICWRSVMSGYLLDSNVVSSCCSWTLVKCVRCRRRCRRDVTVTSSVTWQTPPPARPRDAAAVRHDSRVYNCKWIQPTSSPTLILVLVLLIRENIIMILVSL